MEDLNIKLETVKKQRQQMIDEYNFCRNEIGKIQRRSDELVLSVKEFDGQVKILNELLGGQDGKGRTDRSDGLKNRDSGKGAK